MGCEIDGKHIFCRLTHNFGLSTVILRAACLTYPPTSRWEYSWCDVKYERLQYQRAHQHLKCRLCWHYRFCIFFKMDVWECSTDCQVKGYSEVYHIHPIVIRYAAKELLRIFCFRHLVSVNNLQSGKNAKLQDTPEPKFASKMGTSGAKSRSNQITCSRNSDISHLHRHFRWLFWKHLFKLT